MSTGLLDLAPELISTIGDELGTDKKLFRTICKQINTVLAPNVLSSLVIDLPGNIDVTFALLEELAQSAEDSSEWRLYARKLKIVAFYPTTHAPWKAETTRKCSAHLRHYLQLAISSLRNLHHVSWDVGMKVEPGWLHDVLVASLATLPELHSLEVNIRYARDIQQMKLERISSLLNLKIMFEDHCSNSSQHKFELLGLPRVIENNHGLKKVDILMKAFHNAPRLETYLDELLSGRQPELGEPLTHLGLWGVVPTLTETTTQQLRFLTSVAIHSHLAGDATSVIENFWRVLAEEKVDLKEIVTDRMNTGLAQYLKGTRRLQKLEFLGTRAGASDKNLVTHFNRDILPELSGTLRRLVLKADLDECWCCDPEVIKSLSKCTELRYLGVMIDGILHAKPGDGNNHIVLLINMASEYLHNLSTLRLVMTRESSVVTRQSSLARSLNSQANIISCILEHRHRHQGGALPDISYIDNVFYAVDAGDGFMRYTKAPNS